VKVCLNTAKLPKGDFIETMFIYADGVRSAVTLKGAVE
jgi:hypothetical protein